MCEKSWKVETGNEATGGHFFVIVNMYVHVSLSPFLLSVRVLVRVKHLVSLAFYVYVHVRVCGGTIASVPSVSVVPSPLLAVVGDCS